MRPDFRQPPGRATARGKPLGPETRVATDRRVGAQLAHKGVPGALLPWALAVAFAICFGVDAVLVTSGRVLRRDIDAGQAVRSGFLDAMPVSLMRALRSLTLVDISPSQYRVSILALASLTLATVWILARSRYPFAALLVFAAVGGSVVWPAVFKKLIARPFPPPPGIVTADTFPSSHACVALVVCGVLIYVLRHTGRSAGLWVAGLCIGVAQTALVGLMALEHHYPSEVVGGYALGIAWLGVLLGLLASPLASERRRVSPEDGRAVSGA